MGQHDIDRLLEGLDDEQRTAVLAPVGPVRILAGAGTGKTRTITHRIAYQHLTGVVPDVRVLAVTHSAKAASQMRERLAALGVEQVAARTFHAAALRQLRHFWSATGLPGDGPTVLGSNLNLIRSCLAACRNIHPGAVASEEVLTTSAEISWAHAQLVTPAGYVDAASAGGRQPDVPVDLIAAAYGRYEQAKRNEAVLDFDDLLTWCAHLLNSRPEVASTIRAGYTSFVVDEYQDTNPAQQRLLDAWLGGRDQVCVVGDPTQAIYGFGGADPSLLLGFTRRYPGAHHVELVRNYRSSPQVAEAGNRIGVGACGAGAAGVHLIGQGEPGPQVEVLAAGTEAEEAEQLCSRIRTWLAAGTPAGEIAVLHRYNSQAPALKAALSNAGIPVASGDGEKYFATPEIRRAMEAFAHAVQAEPDVEGATLLLEVLDSHGFDESTPPEGVGAARTRWENQAALLDQARSVPSPAGAQLADGATVLTELTRRARHEHVPTTARGVHVMTIHKAKGLEWDAVAVARATEGCLPAAFATTPAQVLEEQRLAYVATTRARRDLLFTWALRRDAETRRENNRSRYLDTITGRIEDKPAIQRRARTHAVSPVRDGVGAAPRARDVRVGDRVSHDKFGLGSVVAVEGARARIDFGSGERTVRLAEAPMEKL